MATHVHAHREPAPIRPHGRASPLACIAKRTTCPQPLGAVCIGDPRNLPPVRCFAMSTAHRATGPHRDHLVRTVEATMASSSRRIPTTHGPQVEPSRGGCLILSAVIPHYREERIPVWGRGSANEQEERVDGEDRTAHRDVAHGLVQQSGEHEHRCRRHQRPRYRTASTPAAIAAAYLASSITSPINDTPRLVPGTEETWSRSASLE